MPPPLHHLREMRMLPTAERGRRARRCRPRRRARGACPERYRGRSTAPRRGSSATVRSSVPFRSRLRSVVAALGTTRPVRFFFFYSPANNIACARSHNAGTCSSLRPPHAVPCAPVVSRRVRVRPRTDRCEGYPVKWVC